MPYMGKVTTGDKILPELYEISARCQATGRPDYSGTDPARVFNSGALWVWLESAYAYVNKMGDDDNLTPASIRNALLDLATGAVAWAREIREQCQ